MKLIWHILNVTQPRRRKNKRPNYQPLMLWTQETGEWREILCVKGRQV